VSRRLNVAPKQGRDSLALPRVSGRRSQGRRAKTPQSFLEPPDRPRLSMIPSSRNVCPALARGHRLLLRSCCSPHHGGRSAFESNAATSCQGLKRRFGFRLRPLKAALFAITVNGATLVLETWLVDGRLPFQGCWSSFVWKDLWQTLQPGHGWLHALYVASR